MKQLKLLLASKVTFLILTTLVILALNLTPLILQYKHAPLGRTFTLIHNNVQDFYFYQSLMNEGANGAWLTSNPYTSETHPPTVIFSYFVWLGNLSKTLGLSFALTYHLLRIIFSIIFLILAFKLILYLKTPNPKLAYLFFLFAAPFMHKIPDGAKIVSVPYMYWWTAVDPIRRAAYLPHHMLAGILLIVIIITLLNFIKKQNPSLIFLAILLSLPLALVHPPSILILLITLPSSGIVFFLQNFKKATSIFLKPKYHMLVYLLLFWVINVILVFVIASQGNSSIIWSKPFNWEKGQQFPLIAELPFAFGILLPLALLGVLKLLSNNKYKDTFLVSWFLFPLLLIPFAPQIGISNVRLIQGVPYLPFSILAVLGIYFFAQQYEIFADRIRSRVPRLWILDRSMMVIDNLWTKPQQNIDLLRARKIHTRAKITGFFFILFLIFTYPTLSWSLKSQIQEYWPIFGNVYLDNRLENTFAFINNNFPAKTVILSTFYTGNYLPAFTHTTSFIGHDGYTYNMEDKRKLTDKFFSGKMTTSEVKKLMNNNKITLIFQGPEEKPIYNSYLYPNLLQPIYDLNNVTLYVLKT